MLCTTPAASVSKYITGISMETSFRAIGELTTKTTKNTKQRNLSCPSCPSWLKTVACLVTKPIISSPCRWSACGGGRRLETVLGRACRLVRPWASRGKIGRSRGRAERRPRGRGARSHAARAVGESPRGNLRRGLRGASRGAVPDPHQGARRARAALRAGASARGHRAVDERRAKTEMWYFLDCLPGASVYAG